MAYFLITEHMTQEQQEDLDERLNGPDLRKRAERFASLGAEVRVT